MPDRWTIRGVEFSNCNCDWGCPCQFNAPTTHGFCEALGAGRVDQGQFNGTSLDGLHWCLLYKWPGEIAEGNGRSQAIIDERADAAQFEALNKILHGESTAPGASHFYVFNSTMSEVLEPIRAPFETFEVDVEARRARVAVPGLIEMTGSPIIDPNSGAEFRARIDLPSGFEYSIAEMGTGESRSTAGIEISLSGSYGQFNAIHMNQDGVIR
jgi:hypothetical protein